MKPETRSPKPPTGGAARDFIINGFLALLLFAAVFFTFAPVLRNGFIDYDDPDYITDNVHVRQGVTWQNVQWAFSDTQQAGFWHPLTWLSHMTDCQWFGLEPAGHHGVGVFLHALNAVLAFLVFRKLTGARWKSFALAALFGLHPLRVESVAWAAERKDLLATFFWLLTMGAYVGYAKSKVQIPSSKFQIPSSKILYVAALGFFLCGLMSKPMVVTLPCVLLLLDFWPLGRVSGFGFRVSNLSAEAAVDGGPVKLSVLLGEKAPFFIGAIAVSVGTFLAQHASGATSVGVPLTARAGNALVSYVRYLGKLFCPTQLAVFYPHPGFWPAATVIFATLVLAAISVLAMVWRRRRPWFAVGWLWFVGTLLPVIGLIQVGEQSMADRFTYIPCLGVLLMLIWGVAALIGSRTGGRVAGGVLVFSAAVVCVILTREQIGYWRDSETLFRRALSVTENNHVAHFCLGIALEKKGSLDGAIQEYEAALALKPDYAVAHNNLGFALANIGRFDDALVQLQRALALGADPGRAHFGIGMVYGREGRLREAIAEFQEAVALRPDWPEAHFNLGIALERNDQVSEAAGEFRRATVLDPGSAEFHFNLGRALSRLNRLAEAIGEFQTALKLRPMFLECRVDLGNALARAGRLDEAIEQFREAVRERSDVAEAHNNLGLALAMRGSRDDAAVEFEKALSLKPDYADAQKNLDALKGPQKASP